MRVSVIFGAVDKHITSIQKTVAIVVEMDSLLRLPSQSITDWAA